MAFVTSCKLHSRKFRVHHHQVKWNSRKVFFGSRETIKLVSNLLKTLTTALRVWGELTVQPHHRKKLEHGTMLVSWEKRICVTSNKENLTSYSRLFPQLYIWWTHPSSLLKNTIIQIRWTTLWSLTDIYLITISLDLHSTSHFHNCFPASLKLDPFYSYKFQDYLFVFT